MMIKLPVCLEGELIFSDVSYAAFVENISEDGMYLSIAHIMTEDHIRPKTKLFLKVRLPSGEKILLNCKEQWSERNTPHSLIERIGMEIINPPEKFIQFIENT
jgi:hypothetical protein